MKFSIRTTIGLLLGLSIPCSLIFIDLNEVGSALTFDNVTMVYNSQTIFKVSFSLFPLMGLLLGYVFEKLKRDQEIIKDQEVKLINSARLSSLGEMSSGISHEINSPLSVIQGSLEIMEDWTWIESKLSEKEYNKFSKTITRALKSTNSITKIIKGLKSFARDGARDKKEKVHLSNLVDDCLELCKTKLSNNNIDFTLNIDNNLEVECTPASVSQALLNLMNNASDAIQDSEEKWIDLTVYRQDKAILLEVTDCGLGISKEVEYRIFEPFFTTKDFSKGTGLGLSLSKGLIESDGGTLSLDRSCSNTKFVISIPA